MSSTRRVLRAAQPPLRRFAAGAAWGLASAAAAVALLGTSGWLIVRSSQVDTLMLLGASIVGVRFFATSRAVFRYLERLMGHDAALRQLATTRSDVLKRLIPFAPDGISRTDRGAVLSALVDDVEELQNLPLRVVQPVVIGVIVAAGSVAVTAFISPAAALALAACLIAAGISAWLWGWLAGARAERQIAPARAQLTSALTDWIGSFDVLIAYGAEPAARARILQADATLRRLLTKATSAQGASSAALSALAGVASLAAVAIAAGSNVSGPHLAVLALMPMVVFEIFASVPLAASAWRRVHASAERIAEIVPDEVPAELVPDDDASESPLSLSGTVRLRDVHAAWPGGSDVLRGVDLDLAPGERVLVTGSSGAGKSTLAHVLVRFLQARGSYSIGETDVDTVPSAAVRAHIGLVEQQPTIFDVDIRQNLLFADDAATDEELEAVMDRVGLGPWLRERGGLDASAGERGALVSGGQAQRISLARAILHRAEVLVLDEPTAGVDREMSDILLHDLLTASPDQTVLLISHVEPPAQLVDRTLRLDGGKLIPA